MPPVRLLALLLALPLPQINAIESNSLTFQQPSSVVKLQSNEQHTVGLLDTGGGRRTQLVHLAESGKLPTRPESLRRVSHVKAFFLSIGLYAALIRNLVLLEATTRNDWIPVIFFLVLYLAEAASCSTRRYLSNIQTPSQVREYISKLQEAPPRVKFHLECYHYENEDGFRSSSSVSRRRHDASNNSKRVTHRASDVFNFERWRDTTRLNEVTQALEYGTNDRATYLKITLIKVLLFMNSVAYQDYLSQHARFVLSEGNRDRYTDAWTTVEVDGYISKLLACRTVIGSESHVRMPVFWFFTLIGLTVPYRMWFSRNCDALDLSISKEVS